MTFISGSDYASLILIPEQMSGCVLSGAEWPNAVTFRPKFGNAPETITSSSKIYLGSL
jgi:hypothetical protein